MTEMTHVFVWRNNPVRALYCGSLCRIVASLERNSVLIEFEDGRQLVTSKRAIRKLKDKEVAWLKSRAKEKT